MCEYRGIQCYLTANCHKLCAAANEWADQDYVGGTEQSYPPEAIESFAARRILTRFDCIRHGDAQLPRIALDVLSRKQREAIEAVYYDPGAQWSYSALALQLGITKNAAYRRIRDALKRIRKRMRVRRHTK